MNRWSMVQIHSCPRISDRHSHRRAGSPGQSYKLFRVRFNSEGANMDERWRVPDRWYGKGYRWTARGIRARRKWILLISTWFVISALHPVLVGPLVLILIGYAFYRHQVNRKELQQPSQSQMITYVPSTTAPPVGEARKRAPFSPGVKRAVWIRDNGQCRHCGITDAEAMVKYAEHLHYDHIVPFSLNGADTEQNCQLLCRGCNLTKSNKFTGLRKEIL